MLGPHACPTSPGLKLVCFFGTAFIFAGRKIRQDENEVEPADAADQVLAEE
jgi:hypothetical protein